MSDVLVITAPLGSVYPSVNHTHADGFRGGKKSRAYRDLFAAVKSAAEAEMARVGWTTARYYCATSIVLYRNTKREIDLLNTGKCELDALTRAAVWVDDRFARPCVPDTEYDPLGESRVVIIVRRRFPDMHFTADAPESASVIGASAKRPRTPKIQAAAEIDSGWQVNGRPMNAAEVAKVKKKLGIA